MLEDNLSQPIQMLIRTCNGLTEVSSLQAAHTEQTDKIKLPNPKQRQTKNQYFRAVDNKN